MQASHLPGTVAPETQQHYEGLALFADPIHEYIPFTVPLESEPDAREVTEKDLIDSPWVQRLRYIAQLQSARWVFPGAEHSRFQHSLGAMHVAGRFARQLYPSLRAIEPACPSLPYVEAVLRMAALLHDIGHGPFGHFFDENHLAQYGLGHEAIGQYIITHVLGEPLRGLRRSPSGAFAAGETLDPQYVAYIMHKKGPGGPAPTQSRQEPDDGQMPRWLRYLKPVLSGMYTADNLDYVLRDAYMCGVAVGPVDLERLLHYSMLTEHGLTLHKAGIGALTMFLQARLYLYTHVYFHRTSRALDLHLREIFPATMHEIFPGNPLDMLERYRRLTDWSLLETVRGWEDDPLPNRRALGHAWAQILGRQVRWKMAYDATLSVRGFERQTATRLEPEQLVARIRQALPPSHRAVPFHLDVAMQDPRKINLLSMGASPIYIYDPTTGKVCTEIVEDMLEHIPATLVLYRVYTTERASQPILAQACERALCPVSVGEGG